MTMGAFNVRRRPAPEGTIESNAKVLQHALQSVLDGQPVQEVVLDYNPKTALSPATNKADRIMITYDFNLVGVEPKSEAVKNTPLCTGWMVFLNRTRTLAHVMHCDDAADGDYSRIRRLPKNMQTWSDREVRNWFYERMKRRYII